MKLKEKVGKQTILFLVICLPITWILGGVACLGVKGDEMPAWSYALQVLASFMPALTAVFLSLVTKESLWELQFMPGLQKNAKVYLVAIILGVLVVCLELLPTPVLFPKMADFLPEATPMVVFFTILAVISTACIQVFVGMGEELGWMGYLYPRMEKLFGMTGAVGLSILIRGSWHLMMNPWDEYLGYNMLMRCILHIMLVCIGVWLTKISDSIVPASIFHTLLNTMTAALGACMVTDNALYETNRYMVDFVQIIPTVLIGAIFFVVLKKKYDMKPLS